MTQAVAPAENPSIQVAADAARLITTGQFDALIGKLSPDVARGLPAPKLAELWHGLIEQFGAFRSVGPSTTQHKPGFDIVTFPLLFERQTIDLKFSVAAGRIVGLFLAPHQVAEADWHRPDYVDPSAFREIELTVGQQPFVLGATLSLPNSPKAAPAMILVHGSGPGDRDESVGSNRPFRDLAQGLASRGIAVLRYEKRTRSYPEAMAKLTKPTVRDETIDDVNAAVALLRSRTDIDRTRIIVLGHSLGGTLAPRIAAGNPSIDALVILAGATRPLPDIMVEQQTFLTNLTDLSEDAKARFIAEMKAEAERALTARPDDEGKPIFGAPPSYWGDLNAYDPAATAATLAIPMLILQGDRDYQVTLPNLERFRQSLLGHANAEIHELHGLNHLFVAGTTASTPSDYDLPGHVDRSVIDLIADFVDRL